MHHEARSVLRDVVSRASSVKVRNVLNPLLWLCAIVVPAGLAAAIVLRGYPWLAGPIIAVTLFLPVSAVGAFVYFMLTNPQRLQSEEFVLAQHRLIIEEKGSRTHTDLAELPAQSNPELSAPSQGRLK